ncbi:hypothetical protein [Paraperlucidibaca baekdonensis]|nr:hypothetical protein [Paraperlucidibaca baekdonensis]
MTNMIGIYTFIPAKITADLHLASCAELWRVLKKFEKLDLVKIDKAKHYIWVKTWWSHNSASQLGSIKFRYATAEQIMCVPSQWHQEFWSVFSKLQKPENLSWFDSHNLSPCSPEQAKERDLRVLDDTELTTHNEIKKTAFRLSLVDATALQKQNIDPEIAQSKPNAAVSPKRIAERNKAFKIMNESGLTPQGLENVFKAFTEANATGRIKNLPAYAISLVAAEKSGQLGQAH